ncbi:MAG: hypothetical protein KBA75_08950 [Alphaproteobacteria bacterium]|nr:hypothetical protein [Alphaproteobacteria bacterium]
MGTAVLPQDYQPNPAVNETLHRVVDRIIDRNLDGSSQVVTRLGVLMEYGHAAKELHRVHPEVPFRTAFHLVCNSAIHAIA